MKSVMICASAVSICLLAGLAAAAVPKETAATKKSAREVMARIRAIEKDQHNCRSIDFFVAAILTGKAGTRKSPPQNDASGRISEIWAAHACGRKRVYSVVLQTSGKETAVIDVSFAGDL